MGTDASITSLLAEAERRANSDAGAAMATLEAVLAREPAHAVAAIRLGRLKLAVGEAREASALADRALATESDNRWALILKGQAAEAADRPDDAHEAWARLAAVSGAPAIGSFKPTAGETAYRTGVARARRRHEAPEDPATLIADTGPESLLARIDALIRIVDVPNLERLWRVLPEGPVRDYLDFRLWFRMQAYAEPLALAETLIAAPELATRRGEIQGLAARAALMLEDAHAIARWVPATDPPPPANPQRLLNAVWRSDPERGLRLARRIAYSPAESSNAEGLHVFLPLLRDDPDKAKAHLETHLTRHAALKTRPTIELTMAAASVAWTQGRWRDYARAFAAYFDGFGLENPVADDGRPLRFDRLAVHGLERRREGPLVSVIITVFNAEPTLSYALTSLLDQTHANLEVLAVDDLSTDGTLAMLRAAAERDPRITVIANDRNLGTYVSKTRALERATGDYWVCHDGDDWAHPRRIERHVAVMEADPTLVATRSNWLRIDAEGMPFIRRTSGGWTHINPGSPFYRRREVLDGVGVYDRVRIDGDLDHWRRALDHFGPERLAQLRQPLTLGLLHAGSLTRSGSGAQNDEHYSPPRSAYRYAGLQWRRAQVDRGDLKLTGKPGPRPFPAPDGMAVD
ncbi:glycosyltransferase [Brevundimonas sp.]|uniref:glycosyltransferase n=1 Tax=Brevundimonas sp. TaxID=1871086 RepID=UPI0035B1DEE3